LFLSSAVAWADVPPVRGSCDGEKAGTACTISDGVAGVCTADTCTRLVYGARPKKTPDGQEIDDRPGPRRVKYECFKCRPVPAAKPVPPEDTKVPETQPVPPEDKKTPETQPPENKKAPETQPEPPPASSESMFTCSVDPPSGHRPWGALILVFGAALLRRRS